MAVTVLYFRNTIIVQRQLRIFGLESFQVNVLHRDPICTMAKVFWPLRWKFPENTPQRLYIKKWIICCVYMQWKKCITHFSSLYIYILNPEMWKYFVFITVFFHLFFPPIVLVLKQANIVYCWNWDLICFIEPSGIKDLNLPLKDTGAVGEGTLCWCGLYLLELRLNGWAKLSL